MSYNLHALSLRTGRSEQVAGWVNCCWPFYGLLRLDARLVVDAMFCAPSLFGMKRLQWEVVVVVVMSQM